MIYESGSSIMRGRIPLMLLVLLVCFIAVWVPDSAQSSGIYICKGSNGGTHFTNTPTSSDCKIFRKKSSSSFSSSAKRSHGERYQTLNYSDRVPYHAQINDMGDRYRVDPNLIRAVIRAESSFNRYAVSSQGAKGLMQLMPETAKDLKVRDPFNPRQNIEGGTRYLRSLMDTFDGNLTLVLAAYNAGPTLVKRVKRVPRIPETIQYVKRVLGHYKGYSKGQPVSSRVSIRVHDVLTIN